ncbi:MobV family relaxase [Acinetobacter sp. YH12058]|uniref:MobV family relaxase n=1 Tax=Acinetobacter sp. YH12058 TaxID=2601058 RepID=UPI0035A1B37F
MAFAILRTAKLKSFGEIGGSLSHNYRTRFTANADQSRSHQNEHDVSESADAMQMIKNRLPEKLRKNGVLCIEHLITASPDWIGWNNKNAEAEFFEQSKKWLIDRYGSENVITTSIHRDETTPHLIAYVVPMDTTGRLNARKWLGGRKLMSDMQTDFANQVNHLGLKRGVENSKAEHTTIKEFYSEINQQVKPKLPEIELTRLETQPDSPFLDGKKAHGERVIDAVYDHIAPQFENYEKQIGAEFSALNAQLSNEKNKNKKLEKQCISLINSMNQMKELVENYDREFEPFIDLKRKSEQKYEELKQTAVNEHERILQKEIDSMTMTITPKSDFEKQIDHALKNMSQPRPQLDQVQQPEKKKDKGNDFDFSM